MQYCTVLVTTHQNMRLRRRADSNTYLSRGVALPLPDGHHHLTNSIPRLIPLSLKPPRSYSLLL